MSTAYLLQRYIYIYIYTYIYVYIYREREREDREREKEREKEKEICKERERGQKLIFLKINHFTCPCELALLLFFFPVPSIAYIAA